MCVCAVMCWQVMQEKERGGGGKRRERGMMILLPADSSEQYIVMDSGVTTVRVPLINQS